MWSFEAVVSCALSSNAGWRELNLVGGNLTALNRHGWNPVRWKQSDLSPEAQITSMRLGLSE